MEDKNKKIFFSIILVGGLFILAIIFGYWLSKRGNQEITKESEISQLDEKFHLDRDSVFQLINEKNNYPEAIDKLNFLLKENQSSNLNQEANLKIILAETYIYDLEEADFKKGIDILKEVATNVAYSTRWRAMALERLALFANVYGKSFAQENIFNDAFFSPMIKEGSLALAQKRLYQGSLSIDKTVMPYYKIANWYASRLLSDNNLSAESKKKYLQAAKKNLKLGEDLFNESYPLTNWDAERLVMAYETYAEVATKLYLLKEFDDSQKIIDSFDKALAVYEEKYNIQQWPVAKSEIIAPMLRIQLPPLIFHYTSSLAVMQKFDDQGKIRNLIEVLYDKSWNKKNIFNIFAFLREQKDTTYENKYNLLRIVSLAKADSRFADLLISLGWNKKQLSNLPILPLESIK